MKKTLFCLLAIVWTLAGTSQGVISDFETDDFPAVRFRIQSFNPDTATATRLRVIEESKEVPITNVAIIDVPPTPRKSNVLFLWDNSRIGDYTAEMLVDLFNGMVLNSQMSDSLKVDIAVFGRNQQGDKSYSSLAGKFITDLGDAKKAVFGQIEKGMTGTGATSDLLWALGEGIKQVSSQSGDEARAIVLYTIGSNNITSALEVTPVIEAAKKNRVHVYVVNVDGDEVGKTLCERLSAGTYGQTLFTTGSFQQADIRKNERDNKQSQHTFLFVENETVSQWIAHLPINWEGKTYQVTFTSQFERINQTKQISVELGSDTLTSAYQVPGMTLWYRVKTHPILYSLLLVLLLAAVLVGGYYLLKRHNKLKALKEEEEEELENERERLKSDQAKLRQRVEMAESAQRRRQEQETARERSTQVQEQLNAISSLMHSRNARARVLVFSPSGSAEYTMTTPQLAIGLAEDNDIVIADPTVSRHHAQLYYDGMGFGIRDLHSTNGVVMNGMKIDDLKLRNGDSLMLGRTTIKIYL